jgi:hypothetical protein
MSLLVECAINMKSLKLKFKENFCNLCIFNRFLFLEWDRDIDFKKAIYNRICN